MFLIKIACELIKMFIQAPFFFFSNSTYMALFLLYFYAKTQFHFNPTSFTGYKFSR